MDDLLKKIQQRPEAERKIVFWVLITLFGIIFFRYWLSMVKRQTDNLNRDKIKEDLNLPQFKEQLENLPKPELPKIDEEELKSLEELLNEAAEETP